MNLSDGLSRAGRSVFGWPLALARPLVGATRGQFNMSRRTFQDLLPTVTHPSFALILMAVFVHAGREDLASYALVAPFLMSVATTAVFVASELLARERDFETLELSVASPASFPAILFSRIMVVTLISLVGIAESWLIIRFVFGETVTINHPWLFAATMLMTAFASAGTALIPAALFCFAQAARTYQNSILYPVLLVSGVLVPVAVLPDWLEPVSRLVFLYWSANLLRDSMQAATPEGVLWGLGFMAILGTGAAFIGGALIIRMLNYLKREGRLGIL